MTRQTSFIAYTKIKEEGLLSKKRWEVYDILFEHGPLTAHEVVAKARKQYPLSNQTSFNARLSELESQRVVARVGKKINPVSGTENYLWDVTAHEPIKLEKPTKHKCKHCNGTGEVVEQQTKLF